jgi:GST-like protein
MIDLYTAATSNGRRVSIMLEECGLEYHVHPVPLGTPDKPAEFLRLHPLARIPLIVDRAAPGGGELVLSQSAAILLYLGEKTGKFLPKEASRRALVLQWLMHAMTDFAAVSSTLNQIKAYDPHPSQRTVEHFESRRSLFLGSFESRLDKAEYLADEISVADFALYPLMVSWKQSIDTMPGLSGSKRWMGCMAARPGVARGMKVPG